MTERRLVSIRDGGRSGRLVKGTHRPPSQYREGFDRGSAHVGVAVSGRDFEGLEVKSHDVCNNVTSRLIDQLAINNAVSASFPSTTASMSAIDSGLK